jgi:ankyrin repeat protein
MGILTKLFKKVNFSFNFKIPNFREIFISNSIASLYINNNITKLGKKLKKGKKFYKKIKFIENYNYSLLHHSITDNKPEIIDLIFQQTYANDSDVIEDTNNDLGITPIHLASLVDNIQLLHLLIQNGCNPLIRTKDGQSLIHFIAHNGNVKSFDYIYQYYKFDINIITNEDWTALHYACFKNRMDVCSYLIDHNADLNIKNKQGLIPIEVAVLNDNFELFQALLSHHKETVKYINIGYTCAHSSK